MDFRFGDLRLHEVRVRHVAAVMDGLKKKIATDDLAPRTVRCIYGVLKTMYRGALRDELVAVNESGEGEAE